MSQRGFLAAALPLVAAVLVVLPAASASSVDSKLHVGFNLHFTGPDTTAGTFVAAGDIEDAGSSHVVGITLAPLGRSGNFRLGGRQTFTGAHGTIVTVFRGISSAPPHAAAHGTFEIVDASGTYAGMRGGGTFTVVVDAVSNQLIGTMEGTTH